MFLFLFFFFFLFCFFFFFFNDTATTEIYTLSLHDALPIYLHLTDDQGWRIEIKSWPKLTSIGASTEVGGGPGGFYTQEDYREIIDYAQARYITIVPEIEIGRAHVWTPVTPISRMPSSAWKKKKKKQKKKKQNKKKQKKKKK